MIPISIIIYLLFILADSFGDVAIEKGKQKEWHFWGSVLAGLMFAVFNLMHNLRKGDKWNYLSDHGIDGFVKRLIKKL